MAIHSLRTIFNKQFLLTACFLLIMAATSFGQSSVGKTLDLLIKGAMVFDGSGKDSAQLDVGILGDRIAFVGNAQLAQIKAKKVIDATGLYLAPGFIDPHTHSDRFLNSKDAAQRANLPFLAQGVTTVFAGNDGFGGSDIGAQLSNWDRNGIGTNAALFVGHGGVRKEVLGSKNVQPTPVQLDEMRKRVDRAMKEGAIGLSGGLFYAPASYAKTEEVTELAKVAAKYQGVYDTHMRSEGNGVLDGVKETLDIGEGSGIPVHISHIKVSGDANWGRSQEVITMLENALRKGLKVTANQYPYIASSTSLKSTLMPRWAEDGGSKEMLKRFEDPKTLEKIRENLASKLDNPDRADRIVLAAPLNAALNGKSILKISQEWGIKPEDAVIKILQEHPAISVISFGMTEEDVVQFMKQPWVMTGSDGGGAHPRTYGTFARKLGLYALEKKIITLSFAIHSATGLTATTFQVKDRGFIKEGFYADIVLFDPIRFRDNATFEQSTRLASGVEYVLVNGKLSISEGKYNGALAGKALRHAPKTPSSSVKEK